MSEQRTPTDSVPEVDEPECEPASEDPEAQKRAQEDAQARADDVLGTGDEDDFSDDDEPDTRAGSARFAAPGGGFAGSEAPILRAVRIGKRNGLTVTSMKRSSGSLPPTGRRIASIRARQGMGSSRGRGCMQWATATCNVCSIRVPPMIHAHQSIRLNGRMCKTR